jgi:hypothetical protein
MNQEVKKLDFISSCVIDLNKLFNLSVELSLSIFKMRKTAFAYRNRKPGFVFKAKGPVLI